jgi:Fic family protein
MPDYGSLDQLKQKLDAHRPLAREVIKNLHEDLVVRWTYHSNAIEGNTLTLKETRVALEGITIGGKTLTEHFEAVNHREAILFVEDLVACREDLSEWQIRSLHRLILKNIDEENAGQYRRTNVIISGAEHVPPASFLVESEMNLFLEWYRTEGVVLHPVERAARVHADFVKIHPFVDGNGRTARLLMNQELMKAGFPPAVLTVENRLEYYKTLDLAHVRGDYIPFFDLIARFVEEGFKPWFFVLGIQ